MGKTVHSFNHLNIYHRVCCLLSNLTGVLWGSKLRRLHTCLWWVPRGGDGVVGSGDLPRAGAVSQHAASICLVIPNIWGCCVLLVWFF